MTLVNIAVCFLTACAVYLVISQHYHDILREKDGSYWELANRQKTQQYNCEDQCKRQLDSNEKFYSALISAYKGNLKTLLDTDIESIQKREKSYRQVIGVFQSHAVLVSEYSQTSTSWCAHYCNKMEDQLNICNTTLDSLRAARGGLGYNLRRQRRSILVMHKIIDNNRLELESCNVHTRWLSLSLTAILVLIATSVGIAWKLRRAGVGGTDIPGESNETKMVGNEQTIELKAQAEIEDQKRDKEKCGQLTHKLSKAESEALELRVNCQDLEQTNTSLQKDLEDRNQRLKQLETLASTTNQKENTIKFFEKQLAENKERITSLEEANIANVSCFREREFKLLAKETRLKTELTASHLRATKLADELNEARKLIKSLEGHVRVQTVDLLKLQHHHRTTLNTHVLERSKEVEEKETELKESKQETKQLKVLAETRDEKLKNLQTLNTHLKEVNADLEMAVMMKDNDLEMERESKSRALQGQSCQEGVVKSLRAQLKSIQDNVQRSRWSSQRKSTPQSGSDEAHVRLQLYEDFKLEYDRLRTQLYGKLSEVTEMAAKLKTENRLQQIELVELTKRNLALQELLDKDHARIRAQELQERMCRVTFDVYHPSLTPPHHSWHSKHSY